MAQVGYASAVSSRQINSEIPAALRRASMHTLTEGPRGIALRHGHDAGHAGTPKTLLDVINKVRGNKPPEGELAPLEHPPTLEELKTLSEAYLAKIREMQEIMKPNVLMTLRATENEPLRLDNTVGTDIFDQVPTGDWGTRLQCLESASGDRGHTWKTVEAARFKSGAGLLAPSIMKQLEALAEELPPLYNAITAFVKRTEEYSNAVYASYAYLSGNEEHLAILESEADSALQFKDQITVFLLPITKGAASQSFVASLIHQLELSLNLSQNHPGD